MGALRETKTNLQILRKVGRISQDSVDWVRSSFIPCMLLKKHCISKDYFRKKKTQIFSRFK